MYNETIITFRGEPTCSTGRNGDILTTGLIVTHHVTSGSGRGLVNLYPITSKGKRGRCAIEIEANKTTLLALRQQIDAIIDIID